MASSEMSVCCWSISRSTCFLAATSSLSKTFSSDGETRRRNGRGRGLSRASELLENRDVLIEIIGIGSEDEDDLRSRVAQRDKS